MRPSWVRRDVPLSPTTVVGRGEVATRLAERLLRSSADELRRLRGGEGRSSGGRHPVTPWGKPTRGAKTRRNQQSNDDARPTLPKRLALLPGQKY